MKRFAIWILLFGLSSATFAAIDAPTGRVVLTVSGAIDHTNVPERPLAQFDLAMLKQLPAHEITTHNPWEEGEHHYVGFNPKDLLALLKSRGDLIRLTAFNQYITEIPMSDFEDWDTIIAYEMDGEPIPVRNKGPLMVIYNFDQHPELRNEAYYGRSIWQIQSLKVMEP